MDIRVYKTELRSKYKALRRAMPPQVKAERDRRIASRLTELSLYKECKVLLTYVSTEIEVDTHEIIRRALADGKRVAVPKCIDGTRDMEFFFISSLSELKTQAFGVLEPVPERCERLTDTSGAVCLVPGLVFDLRGYRLGYGKGYYDRYLSAHPDMKRIGLCYCSCTVGRLVTGRFDVRSNKLVTDKYVKSF